MRYDFWAVWILLMGMPVFGAEHNGLAAKYPADAGLEKDPAVLFFDNFESGTTRKWEEVTGPVEVVGEGAQAGEKCVRISMHRGKDHGGHAIKWFMPGADRVYCRFYVKFSDNYQYSHHFVTLLGSPRNDRWRAFGKAGLKPDGTYFSTGMEPWFAWGKNPPPGEVNLYTYSMDMEIDRKMNKYWGNGFFPPGPGKGQQAGENRVIPPLGKWQCWEFMIQTNTPGRADGKQAMWVDGKLAGEFTGLRWRSREDVKVNTVWLQHYGYDGSDPTNSINKGQEQSVWFDDVVVAREYVGPMSRR